MVIGLSVFAALLLVGFLVIGWITSSKILAVSPQAIEYDQTITAIAGERYTISGSAYNVQGVVGGIRTDGSMIGIFSRPTDVQTGNTTSIRTLNTVTGRPLEVGQKISLQGNIWTTDPKTALGIDYQTVTYPDPLGPMHAWLIPGSDNNVWTIGVHGNGGDKTEMLRFIKPVHAAGSTMLVVNYRNDPGNPRSPDGHNHLGDSEWQDVQAAVAYARNSGATTINLYGDSLGGSLIENYLRRSSDGSRINRVVLDSPALDWEQILKHRAETNGYPTIVYYPAAFMLRLRAGISVKAITTKASNIHQQTLIIHSAADSNVPQAASKAIAVARPDKVQLVDYRLPGHVRSWNYDPSGYEATVTNFLQGT
jgi:uncharacterized protein